MKLLSLLLVSCLIFATVAHAGGGKGIGAKDIRSENPIIEKSLDDWKYDVSNTSADLHGNKDDCDVKIKDAIVDHLAIRHTPVRPSEGFALGLHGAITKLAYKWGPIDLSVGYISVNNDQQGLIKCGMTFYKSKDNNTQLKIGGAAFPGSATTSYGIYLEAEQYLTKSISIIGDLYPVMGGDQTDIGRAVLGARHYI